MAAVSCENPCYVPSPNPLLRLTTSGGTEVECHDGHEDSEEPIYVRGVSGQFECNLVSLEPVRLELPTASSKSKPKTESLRLPLKPGLVTKHRDESQCSTEDTTEASPPLSPHTAVVPAAATGEATSQELSALDEFAPGIPTVGSNGHYLGKCKPCAFVFKDGCSSGVACPFCHLCEPGEKKRRKKERKQVSRTLKTTGMSRTTKRTGVPCALQPGQRLVPYAGPQIMPPTWYTTQLDYYGHGLSPQVW